MIREEQKRLGPRCATIKEKEDNEEGESNMASGTVSLIRINDNDDEYLGFEDDIEEKFLLRKHIGDIVASKETLFTKKQ